MTVHLDHGRALCRTRVQCGYDDAQGSEEWSRVSLLKGRKKTSPNTDLSLPEKYPEKYPDGHPVKTKKIEDLKMIPYIPTEHRQFYEDLQDHVTAEYEQ